MGTSTTMPVSDGASAAKDLRPSSNVKSSVIDVRRRKGISLTAMVLATGDCGEKVLSSGRAAAVPYRIWDGAALLRRRVRKWSVAVSAGPGAAAFLVSPCFGDSSPRPCCRYQCRCKQAGLRLAQLEELCRLRQWRHVKGLAVHRGDSRHDTDPLCVFTQGRR